MRSRRIMLLVAVSVLAAACSTSLQSDDRVSTTTGSQPSTQDDSGAAAESGGVTTGGSVPEPGTLVPPPQSASLRNQFGYEFPPAPTVPVGAVDQQTVTDISDLLAGITVDIDFEILNRIGATGDARLAWLITDIMRLVPPGQTLDRITEVFESLTATSLDDDPVSARSQWQSATDHMIAWDVPAVDGYVVWKAELFTLVDERWRVFFDDPVSDVDWRHVSWGGVLIDDRPLGDDRPCAFGCIPALDDPAVTDAAEGDWYPDDAIVFGVTLGGEARAYPKNIMEVHEMVNDTLGGRRLGIPYCTLCGSAQAYLTDDVAGGREPLVLRTSGLLSRSNKVMYDLASGSIIDTFTGEAMSGPLREAMVALGQVSVVTSTWGDWRQAHPDTTIVARDGGIGRSYDLDPLGGRDDNGAIFPIGDVDERLEAQAKVLGVVLEDGSTVAVPVRAAREHLDAGGTIDLGSVEVVRDASGLRAVAADGSDAGGHEAFWFAWSQFHPETVLWQPSQEPVTGD